MIETVFHKTQVHIKMKLQNFMQLGQGIKLQKPNLINDKTQASQKFTSTWSAEHTNILTPMGP